MSEGVTCWAWHFQKIMTGEADEVPVQWQRGTSPFLHAPAYAIV
jgi:hypothetical protein